MGSPLCFMAEIAESEGREDLEQANGQKMREPQVQQTRKPSGASRTELVSYGLIVVAAVCWGIIGVFNRTLTAAGFSQMQIAFVRCFVAFVVFGLYLLATDRAALRIKLRDIWCFLGTGVLALAVLNWSYFSAMQEMSLSVAAVMMYMAPVVVVLLSAVFFKERITAGKVVALVLVLVGAVFTTGLASGLLGGQGTQVSPLGLLFGVLSAVSYALYSIFSRFALQRGYSANTISFYSFAFSALACGVFADLPDLATHITSPSIALWGIALGVITYAVAYKLYTTGLRNVETGKAAILATLEMVVATLVSVFAFAEPFGVTNFIGIACVFGGIAIMNLKPSGNRARGDELAGEEGNAVASAVAPEPAPAPAPAPAPEPVEKAGPQVLQEPDDSR